MLFKRFLSWNINSLHPPYLTRSLYWVSWISFKRFLPSLCFSIYFNILLNKSLEFYSYSLFVWNETIFKNSITSMHLLTKIVTFLNILFLWISMFSLVIESKLKTNSISESTPLWLTPISFLSIILTSCARILA